MLTGCQGSVAGTGQFVCGCFAGSTCVGGTPCPPGQACQAGGFCLAPC